MKRKVFTLLMAFLAIAGNAVWAQGEVHGSLQEPIDISSYDDAYLIDKEEGTWYLTTNDEVNTHGIKVGGNLLATNPAEVKIYLINTSFDVGGSAIVIGTGETGVSTDVIRYVDLELVLVGENTITSEGSAAAIKLRNDETVTLTISEESTGILNINMTGNGAVNQVAIGERGSSNWDPQYDCGSMYVNGGTIVTNGYIGEFDSHSFNMEGNGIVIAKDIVTSDIHKNWLVDDGIYYETGDNKQNALNVVGDVTIKSPIPEDYPLYIGEGNSLTLGEGDVLEADKVTISGGTLNAYEVSYTSNTASGVTVSPETISTKYMGKNTSLDKFSSITPETLYSFWGWMYNSKEFVSATPNTDPYNKQEYKVNGVWVLKNYTGEEVEKGTAIENISLIFPGMATSLFTVTKSTEDKLPADLSYSNGAVSGTLNASGMAKYTISQGDKTQEATLTFKVKDDGQGGEEPETPIEIGKENGYSVNESDLSNFTYTAEDLTETVKNTIKVYFTKDGKQEELKSDYYTVKIEPEKVQDAQDYTITITGNENMGYKGTVTGAFTVAKAELTIKVNTITCEVNGTPDFSGVFTCVPLGEDEVGASWKGEKPEGEYNLAAAGDYTVSYPTKDIELNGPDADNYKLPEKVEGVISVTEAQGGDDEDKTDINDVEAFIKYHEKIFVYNGEEQDPTYLVVVKDKDGESEYTDDVDYTVSILDENGEAADFIKAGDYTLVVTPTPDGRLAGESITLDEKLTIYPKEVKVIAKDINYTIGKEVSIDKELFSFAEGDNGICAVDEGAVAITAAQPSFDSYTLPGTYTITYTNVELIGSAASNYKLGSDVMGKVIVKKELTDDETLQPGNSDDKDAEITLGDAWIYDNGRYKQVYDGKEHPIESILVKTNEGWKSLSTDEFEVTYDVTPIKNAGEYNVTIELDNEYYKCKVDLKLWINKKELLVELNIPDKIVEGEEFWKPGMATFEGEVAGEEGLAQIDATLSITPNDASTVSVKVQGLKLLDNDAFLAKNYEPVYMQDGKVLTVDNMGDVDIPGTIEIEDQAPAEDVKPNEDGWASEDGKTFTRVYDGMSHAIEAIVVDNELMTDGFRVTYDGADSKVKDAGRYKATITFDEGQYGPTTITLIITPRPMHVWFNLPATVEKAGIQLPAADYVAYEPETEGRGLIGAEGSPAIESGVLSISLPIDGKCSVKLMNFVLDENGEGFLPGNYQPQVWDATQGVWVDYTEGTEVVIVDPSDPDNDGQNEEGNPNGDGGSGITVDDGDDDNPDNPGTDPDEPGTDPDEPGTDPDDPTTDPDDPTKPEWPINPGKPGQGGSTSTPYYKHYNVSIEDVCDGIELSASRNVVREGNQVSIYMKIEEGCDTTGMKLEYKRGDYGYWDDLKLLEGVQPGEYIIKHIYTDIYVRATGAKMDDSATGIEDLGDTQTKVYTQDGRIYVYAPERADVQIVNMAGVVVQRSEQIGLQAYDRLNPGIYIVRVGDEVFKVKL